MSVVDASMTREVIRDISKRPLDLSGLDVHVSRGVVYLHGRLDKIRGYYDDTNLHQELMSIVKLLKQRPGIRDVVCEVELAGSHIIENTAPRAKRFAY
ncbi:MAG: hypothetical protein ABFD54_16590 [Armatimonadota bacterium]|nr:hypothetical protein [bacterium]